MACISIDDISLDALIGYDGTKGEDGGAKIGYDPVRVGLGCPPIPFSQLCQQGDRLSVVLTGPTRTSQQAPEYYPEPSVVRETPVSRHLYSSQSTC